jgi:transposase InsO family protein
MNNIYYDPSKPGSFGGVSNLSRNVHLPEKDVKEWMTAQDTYTLHKPARVNFRRRRTITKGVNDLFQMDLVDLSSLARYNDNYRYILTCIDALSKFAFAVPLRNKSGKVVKEAMASIISVRKPNYVQTDKGTEFLNNDVQRFLEDNDIKFYTSENDTIKASICERFNRTLKERMYRYFTYKTTLRYLDVLQALVSSYNNTVHSSTDLKPSEVDESNESYALRKLYRKKLPLKYKFEVDDRVRISENRREFKKGYLPHWTIEIFTIKRRFPTDPPTYEICDYNGEVVKGKFYAEELQKVTKTDDIYRVEKIIKTRKKLGRTEYFVKWLGYPDSFNSWTIDILDGQPDS